MKVAAPAATRIARRPVPALGRPGRPPVQSLGHLYGLDDYDDDYDDYEEDDEDDDFDDDIETSAEEFSELTGIPKEVLLSIVGGDREVPPLSGEGLSDLVAHLRAHPVSTAPPTRPLRPTSIHSTEPRLFTIEADRYDDDERPNHIARGRAEVEALLDAACEEGWAVRMSYVNSSGHEREFFAEIIDVGRGNVRLRYLDTHGGGELAIWRIQWARVATEAEEDNLI